jgi:cytochrome P450
LTIQAEERLASLTLRHAGIGDTFGFALGVAAPTFAKGVIFRRSSILGWLEALGVEDRAIARLGRLRDRYRCDLLQLAVPGRPQILVLSARAATTVLDAAPEPFSPATLEKRAALAHFEPRTSLISTGNDRAARRAASDAALQSGSCVHALAGHMEEIIGAAIASLLHTAPAGELKWPAFRECWSRIVRHVVLGNMAAGDRELTAMLDALRKRANWAFLRRRDEHASAAFHVRLTAHLAAADANSLASQLPPPPAATDIAVADQVTQWLFAFDAVGIVIFRTLAVLLADGEFSSASRAVARSGPDADLGFLRHCALECLRLWPTTPAILREATRQVRLRNTAIPLGSSVIIYSPFLHRDKESVSAPDSFLPGRWADPDRHATFVPFSAGPAECPAHHLVPMLVALTLKELIGRVSSVSTGRPLLVRKLPGTLDHTRLRFLVR